MVVLPLPRTPPLLACCWSAAAGAAGFAAAGAPGFPPLGVVSLSLVLSIFSVIAFSVEE